MPSNPEQSAAQIRQLNKYKGSDQIVFFEGILFGAELQGFLDYRDYLSYHIENTPADPGTINSWIHARNMVLDFIETRADQEGLSPADRWWRGQAG